MDTDGDDKSITDGFHCAHLRKRKNEWSVKMWDNGARHGALISFYWIRLVGGKWPLDSKYNITSLTAVYVVTMNGQTLLPNLHSHLAVNTRN